MWKGLLSLGDEKNREQPSSQNAEYGLGSPACNILESVMEDIAIARDQFQVMWYVYPEPASLAKFPCSISIPVSEMIPL